MATLSVGRTFGLAKLPGYVLRPDPVLPFNVQVTSAVQLMTVPDILLILPIVFSGVVSYVKLSGDIVDIANGGSPALAGEAMSGKLGSLIYPKNFKSADATAADQQQRHHQVRYRDWLGRSADQRVGD
jgi:hypothetical protein